MVALAALAALAGGAHAMVLPATNATTNVRPRLFFFCR